MKNKYDEIIMPINIDGKHVGDLVRKRTARQAWEQRVFIAELKKQWQEAIKRGTVWRTPIIGEKYE